MVEHVPKNPLIIMQTAPRGVWLLGEAHQSEYSAELAAREIIRATGRAVVVVYRDGTDRPVTLPSPRPHPHPHPKLTLLPC